MRYLGKPFLMGLFCSICTRSLAQSNEASSLLSTLSVGGKAHYGFFVVNQPKAEYVRDSHTFFGELTVSTQTTGKNLWQQVNNNPQIGISFLYGNSGSREYIGHVAALFPYMQFPLVKTAHGLTSFRLGFGAGWVQKPYDKETNTKNLLIGTRLNGCINMLFEQEWRLHHNWRLNTGFSFTHLSNGSFTLPNLGLNIPAIFLGLRYAIQPVALVTEKQQWPSFQKKWHYSIFTYAAGKQSYPLESPVYLVNTVLIEAAKDISRKGRLGAGLNATFDRSLSKETETFEFDKSEPQWQASAYALYERVIGNLSIPFQVGFYVFNKYQFTPFYQVVGLRYRFLPHWVAGLQLKAHLGKADYLQWGLGYKF